MTKERQQNGDAAGDAKARLLACIPKGCDPRNGVVAVCADVLSIAADHGRLREFAEAIYVADDSSAWAHDRAAQVLDEPSLAHGFAQRADRLLEWASRTADEALTLARTFSEPLDAAMELARALGDMKVGERLTDVQFAALAAFTAVAAGAAGESSIRNPHSEIDNPKGQTHGEKNSQQDDRPA